VSRLIDFGRTAGSVGAWVGVAAGAAAVGFATERYVMGRSLRGADPYADEPLGSLRGDVHPVVTDDDVALHVEVDEPDSPGDLTVVLSHGYALNLDAWHFQRRALRGSVRLVFWDQRSHGRSSAAPDDSVTLDRLAGDLGQVIDTVAPTGPLVLVGHSMGGITTLALARQRPELFTERVVGVGLVASTAKGLADATLGLPGPVGRLANRLAPGVVAGLARRPEIVEHGRRAGSDLGYVVTKLYSFGDDDVSPALVEFTAAMNANTPIGVLSSFLPLFAKADLRDAVPVIAPLPTLVIGAALDKLTSVEYSRDLAATLPHVDYVEAADSGHMLMLDRHELVTDGLARLIERARRRVAGTTVPAGSRVRVTRARRGAAQATQAADEAGRRRRRGRR
jgi:pimeloyl-ACP methyl ester carboxylesterase